MASYKDAPNPEEDPANFLPQGMQGEQIPKHGKIKIPTSDPENLNRQTTIDVCFINEEMKDVLKAVNDDLHSVDKGDPPTEEDEKAALQKQMKSKVLSVYTPGLTPTNTDELQNMSDSEKFSFNDLIQHQWFGSNFFQVFVSKKDDYSIAESD